MSLLLNDTDFYYTSILNEETLNSSIINLNGVSGVLKGVNDKIEGSSTTDDLPEGKTNLYFTTARAQGAFTAGTGIVISSGTISNSGVISLTGTTNRITVSAATGNITLSGPQDINTTSSPTFNSLTLNGTLRLQQISCLLAADIGGNVLNASTSANLAYNTTFRTLDTVQDIQTTSNTTFNSLTLSSITPLSLPAGNFSSSILYCDSSAAAVVSPMGIMPNLKISGSSGLYTLDTKQNLQITSTPTFAGLTLGTLSGVLKATAGVIQGSATTDDLLEGKTNLYFTTARAQGAFTAGTGITITAGTIANSGVTAITAGTNITTSNIAGNYTINTTTNPTFNNLTITSMNSNVPDGVSLGTSAGASGRYNAYIGTQAGTGSIGSGNVGIGYQALAGAGSGSFGLGFTAGYQALTNGNIAIGGSTGQNILTGSGYNIYIGGSPSSSSASYETVIGASASAPVGKGNNTCYIPNSAGLYYYTPYSINLWNNNAGTVSQVEQWVLNNTANSGIANIGTPPTITSGVLTNIPVGVYSFNITGFITTPAIGGTIYPTLQYKASGGSYVKVAMTSIAFPNATFAPIAITANIRISNVADAIRLAYDTGSAYGNTGIIPPIYAPAGNYLPRYMTITFISL